MRSNNDASGDEVYQRRWLEERGQWLEHVHRVHLALASGKWQASTTKNCLKIILSRKSNFQKRSELKKSSEVINFFPPTVSHQS